MLTTPAPPPWRRGVAAPSFMAQFLQYIMIIEGMSSAPQKKNNKKGIER